MQFGKSNLESQVAVTLKKSQELKRKKVNKNEEEASGFVLDLSEGCICEFMDNKTLCMDPR